MITSTIGRVFLEAYNEKHQSNYDAKTFFLEKFHPVFFDDNKYLMTAGNSPLENPKISWDKMISGREPFESDERRIERLKRLLEKIENESPEASTAIGFPSSNTTATTSGQVSSLKLPSICEDSYLSWIGGGLGIGVAGGLTILYFNKQILLDIFEGWSLYREFLNNTSKAKGNQIGSWNAIWLCHKYNPKSTMSISPMEGFSEFIEKDKLLSLPTTPWCEVTIAIAKRLSDPRMMSYIYNIGQTNTTIGFIPFSLRPIRRAFKLYDQLFADSVISGKREAEKLWGTAFTFRELCKRGQIGIEAMEPKGLRSYLDNKKKIKINNSDKEETIKFNVYITWIMAVLNNEQLWEKSKEFAESLKVYSLSGQKGKKVNTQRVENLLDSNNKLNIIKNLTTIVGDVEEKAPFTAIAELVNTMPSDNVPYFMTLIRFNYASSNH